jgi:hypothetical protein
MLRSWTFLVPAVVALVFPATGFAQSRPMPERTSGPESLPEPVSKQISSYSEGTIDAYSEGDIVWEEEPFLEPIPYGPEMPHHGWVGGGHFSVEVEALVWWPQGMWLPPLVTTSPSDTPLETAGVLADDFAESFNTTIILGQDRETFSNGGGARVSLAYWTDPKETLGVVGNYF